MDRLLDNPNANGGEDYLDTTFSDRRFDLFETNPASKNTLLLNGVGINNPAQAGTRAFSGPGWEAFRVDLTGALWWGNPSNVPFCARLFILFKGPFALIIDRVVCKTHGRMEARFHTFSKAVIHGSQALIRGRRSTLSMAFASDVTSSLHITGAALTRPGQQCAVLRFCTDTRTQSQCTFATLLSPGKKKLRLEVRSSGKELRVSAQTGGARAFLRISADLKRVARGRAS